MSSGWHHLTAVGKGDTTLFYIDGQKVGDTKAKALADAEENLKKTPNDAAAKQKLEAIKTATLKVSDVVRTIGNSTGTQPFGKLSEFRIWGVALSDDEIAVNSKTLLSGNEPGLLAYYPMSEATGGQVRDHSGNGNNATVSGANWWGCTAPIGNINNTVVKFDGVNDYIDVTAGILPDSYTKEAWIKWESGANIISGNTDNSHALWTPNGKLSAGHNSKWGYVQDTTTLPENTWIHVAVTYDSSTQRMELYKNGQLIAKSTNVSRLATSHRGIVIGAFGDTRGAVFKGSIAEVRIWNKARTQGEIQADAYKRLSGKEPNLYQFSKYQLQIEHPGYNLVQQLKQLPLCSFLRVVDQLTNVIPLSL
ncbi:LamG domain-containing protein [Microcystis aeruginosa]|uniref:LamG domain-containing protein n=1 Tax=Microcystis aeruginosa TaxID=1126 RepID=UPI001C11C1F2|nr:LamG-like jellyroll fold domain-containing protein [Microcystis aeruginosa]